MDTSVVNDTPYTAETLFFGGARAGGQSTWTVIVKGTFDLVNGGMATPADEQHPTVNADIHTGDPAESAVRYESDMVPFKPRADVLCVGKAYPPGGKPAPYCLVSFGLGKVTKQILVQGERKWLTSMGRMSAKAVGPKLFESLEVSYDNAYGGWDADKPDGIRYYPANSVGKGYTRQGKALDGLLLPNLEDPRNTIKKWTDHPAPRSFGPVMRHWVPRIKKMGTYNKKWLKEDSPELPEDFDENYYNCAPEDQQVPGYLKGNEEISVTNMHPEVSPMSCRLPGVRIRSFIDRPGPDGEGSSLAEITMNLDTLWVDLEARQMVLVWRGCFPDEQTDEQFPVLIVHEPLDSERRAGESYRPALAAAVAAEREAESESEEAEREINSENTNPGGNDVLAD